MRFHVRLSRSADRYLDRLPRNVQARVIARLDQVAEDPLGPHTKRLADSATRRSARVGALRIVFTVAGDRRLVNVSDLGPRGEIYRER